MANKKHYYFKISMYSRIMDSIFNDCVGLPVEEYYSNRKAVWDECFKVYQETDEILAEIQGNTDTDYFPLHKWLGTDEEDYLFDSMEDALKQYENEINESVADRMYDL